MTTEEASKESKEPVSMSSELKEKKEESNQKTKLEQKFAFWFRISEEALNSQNRKSLDSNEYENQVKKIAEFDTVEDFWAIYQHIKKPDICKAGIEYQIFKDPIKPMWENEFNKNGGKLVVNLRKGYTTIIWEEMLLALIGGILPKEIKDEINGIVVSMKPEYNTMQIWFRNYNNKIITELEQCIRDLLQIPQELPCPIIPFFKKEYPKKKNYYDKGYNDENYEKYDYYGKSKDYYYYQGYEGGKDYKKKKNNYYKKTK